MADDPPTTEEREAWAQLFASYGEWLSCCLMPGPLHLDDCEGAGDGTHRE